MALALERLGPDLRRLSLAQPEEPVAVPARAGHRFGDLGQATEVLAVPVEAFFQNHDAFELALPFADQQRAGPQGDPVASLSIAPIKLGGVVISLFVRLVSKKPAHGLIEIAESGDLQAVAQHLHEQPPREMGGRFSAEVVAPLSAERFQVETFEAGKNCRQRSVA
jgi:hypothetical protein